MQVHDIFENNKTGSTSSSDSGVVIKDNSNILDNVAYLSDEHSKKNSSSFDTESLKFFNKSNENHLKDFENVLISPLSDKASSSSLPTKRSFSSTTSSNNISINSIENNRINDNNNLNDDDISDCNSTVYSSSDDDDDGNGSSCGSDVVEKLGKQVDNKKKFNQISKNDENNTNVINLNNEINLENGPIVLSQQLGETNSLGIPDLSTGLNINQLSINGKNENLTIGTKIVCQEYTVYVHKSPENTRRNRNDNNECTQQKNDEKTANGETKRRFSLKSKAAFVTGSVILTFLLLGGIIVGIYEGTSKNTGDGDDSRKNIPVNSSIGNDILAAGSVFRFVTRDEWVAQPPNNELVDLELPSNRVVIAHTATEGCLTQAACTFRTRFIQTFHMESRSYDDIAYNFLVGGDGAVYEGRGWDKMGAHSKGYNVKTICIAFIGTFIKTQPTDGQLNVAKLLIEEGVRLKKLTEDYRLYGHRQFIPTESPGDVLYAIIQTWPHYSKELV